MSRVSLSNSSLHCIFSLLLKTQDMNLLMNTQAYFEGPGWGESGVEGGDGGRGGGWDDEKRRRDQVNLFAIHTVSAYIVLFHHL